VAEWIVIIRPQAQREKLPTTIADHEQIYTNSERTEDQGDLVLAERTGGEGSLIVAKSPSNQYVAIEVSFQVTTNSVIERKAGQARARAQLLREAGHRLAYVIDGAGNFDRDAALRTICRYSDCTVAFTPEEINVLVEFLRELA
jgi:hypothetical protein